MCGIFAVLSNKGFSLDKVLTDNFLTNARKLTHRGDTERNYVINNKLYLYHRRLAINDLTTKAIQPFYINNIFSMCNGEFYNYYELKQDIIKNLPTYKFKSTCDSEILIPLYLLYGSAFINKLVGMFSFVLYDTKKNVFIVSRDHTGITSLYYGKKGNDYYFASEMKALIDLCDEINIFQPGNTFINDSFYNSYSPDWYNNDLSGKIEADLSEIRNKLIQTVKAHTLSDQPIGILLSGGLDSSLIAAIIKKLKNENQLPNMNIRTFTIGVENSDDIVYADKVAKHINSDHTAYNFSPEDAITVLEDVITSIETYDITTVRASIPLYLLTMWIKEDTDIKVLLSGEGSDEMFGGYLYFKYAPNEQEFNDEIVDKVRLLHKYDNLRAHKSAMANTIELRVPFEDKNFLNYIMSIHPRHKMIKMDSEQTIEKYILRKSFDIDNMLPNDVLYRQKMQFSDGVSSTKENVINALKQHANTVITDDEFNNKDNLYPIHTPLTKEGLLYRKIFENVFGKKESVIKSVDHNTKSISCSTQRALAWMDIDENNPLNDPSGDSIANYELTN